MRLALSETESLSDNLLLGKWIWESMLVSPLTGIRLNAFYKSYNSTLRKETLIHIDFFSQNDDPTSATQILYANV